MKKVKAVPEGYHSASPSIVVRNAYRAIDFYKRAFGAQELSRFLDSRGKIMHAEIKIGDSIVMLNDEYPEMGSLAPTDSGKMSFLLHLYVDNADAVFNQSVSAGATVKMPMADMFWGDRYGQIRDPFGHVWSIATHKEDLTQKEMKERAEAFFAQTARK